MNLCMIFGTRPQIIKSQPVIKEILAKKANLTIIHTGQHYDFEMSKAFFNELKIRTPDYNLGIKSGSSSKQLSEIISRLEKPLKKIDPDVVIVPGDTRSALGAGLSAKRLGFSLAHIESGARSFDLKMEEEINRRLIDHCADLLFAPTRNCYKNLVNESVLGKIFLSGDTMYDVFLQYQKLLKLKPIHNDNTVIMTIHRQENINNYSRIKKIIEFATKISKTGYEVIFPIHPHTKKQIKSFGLSQKNINTIQPVKYSQILQMLSSSKLLLTDSGGLQKEAFWLNTPCLTLRENTEWIETLHHNHNTLIQKIPTKIPEKIKAILKSKFRPKLTPSNLFGDGKASKKIASILLKHTKV